MRRNRKFLKAILAVPVVVVLGAAPAFAAVGLPYTFTVDWLSGGENGIRTPTFTMNSAKKLCVDPNLYNYRDWYGGPSGNDNRYKTEIWRDDLNDDLLYTINFSLSDEPKKCVVNLPANTNMYVRIKKTKYVDNQVMKGTGVVSYT